MNQRQGQFIKILSVIKTAEKITGRKKLQKIIFILKSVGLGFREKYKYHYYGPYSGELQLELEELIDRSFIIESEGMPYSYSVSNPIDFDVDPEIIVYGEFIKKLNRYDTRVLELISTIIFLEQTGVSDHELLRKKVLSLKPHLANFVNEAFGLRKDISAQMQ